LSVKVATLETFLAMVKTLDHVRPNSLYLPTIVVLLLLAEFDTKACSVAVKDPYKGAGRDGSCVNTILENA
jgi:hypothetical protein